MLISDIDEHAPVMGLFKGESGTGKTTAACTFPRPIKVWSLDDRMKSVAMYLKKHEMASDIEIMAVGPQDFVRFIDDFGKTADPYSQAAMFHDGRQFKTFVLDGLTSLGTMILQYCISVRGSKTKERCKGIIKLPEIDDFMGESNALEKILSYARKINETANFIMTAHEVEAKSFDITTKTTHESRSLLTGGSKVAAKVPIYFDEVWHFEAETEYTEDGTRSAYKVLTQHAGRDFARTSLPLPAVMDWTGGTLWQDVEKFLPPKPDDGVVDAETQINTLTQGDE